MTVMHMWHIITVNAHEEKDDGDRPAVSGENVPWNVLTRRDVIGVASSEVCNFRQH